MASIYFTYAPTAGTGSAQISVSADTQNATTADTISHIGFSAGTNYAGVTLRQKYQPKMNQFGSSTFPDTGGTIYFTVNTEYDIVFRSVPDWITITKNGVTYTEGQRISSGSASGTYALVAAPNSGEQRTVNYMNMGHYIGNTLQNQYSYFYFTQKTSNRILPLTMTIHTGGTINFKHNRTLVGDVGNLTVQYKVNDGSWTNLTSSGGGASFQVNAGDTVQFKGDNPTYSTLPLSYTTFSGSTATFSLAGNIMSLVNSTGFSGMSVVSNEYQFNRLFAGTNVIVAENLAMPATKVAQHAYTSMFQDCTQLVNSPELPAQTLTTNCYDEMFKGCSSLNHIRCYATNTGATNSTYNWVQGVASAGTFVKHTNMTAWTVGNNGIPTNWVVQNYTPTYVTKTMTIVPSMVDVGSAATSTTVSIVADNCNYSAMTVVTGGSFPITVASVQNNEVTLTFPENTTVQRLGTLAVTLYDTEGGSYSCTVSVSQAAAGQSYSWSAVNTNSSYGIYGNLMTGNSANYCGLELQPRETEQHSETVPATITGAILALSPNPANPASATIIISSDENSMTCSYNGSLWAGTGSIPIQDGSLLTFVIGTSRSVEETENEEDNTEEEAE